MPGWRIRRLDALLRSKLSKMTPAERAEYERKKAARRKKKVDK